MPQTNGNSNNESYRRLLDLTNIHSDLAVFQIFFVDWILNRDLPTRGPRLKFNIYRSISFGKNNTSRNVDPISSLQRA